MFNPQTGETVEVRISPEQLARERAEEAEKARPVPVFRGRFRVGADGKLSAEPISQAEERRLREQQQHLLIQNEIPASARGGGGGGSEGGGGGNFGPFEVMDVLLLYT